MQLVVQATTEVLQSSIMLSSNLISLEMFVIADTARSESNFQQSLLGQNWNKSAKVANYYNIQWFLKYEQVYREGSDAWGLLLEQVCDEITPHERVAGSDYWLCFFPLNLCQWQSKVACCSKKKSFPSAKHRQALVSITLWFPSVSMQQNDDASYKIA